jgi:hypothetical protein
MELGDSVDRKSKRHVARLQRVAEESDRHKQDEGIRTVAFGEASKMNRNNTNQGRAI